MSNIKIKPDQIAFDIDGVVADTMSAFIDIARNEFGINSIRKEQITTYWLEDCLSIDEAVIKAIIERILTDPFGIDLKPMDGAVETLGKLAHRNPIRFVTARPVREPIEEWLKSILGSVSRDRIHVIATGKHEIKVEVLKELGISFFVEDHLETCQEICQQGLKAIVYDHPWNQGPTPFLRVKSWQELSRLLEF